MQTSASSVARGPANDSTRIVFGASSAGGAAVTGPGKPSAGQLGFSGSA